MGNRISIRKRSSRRAVEERFTRPQRLILEPSNVNYKKLRKLILKEKLAPCFDVVEESNPDLEECPICCFYFPSLNRSRCCMKGICTECFLQMKPSNNSMRPAQCPFCKCSIYAVEFRGARTQEERNLEQAEEQKVIEAKIRMRSEESEEVNRVTQTLAEQILSDTEVQSPLPSVWQQPTSSGNAQDLRDWQLSFAQERIEGARHEDFDVDLEEIMIAEAIWQSMQQANASQPSGPSCMGGLDSACHGSNERRSSLQLTNQVETTSTESVTGGLAYAIARFAEQNIQQSPRFQSVLDNDMPEQADENFAEDDRSMQDTISPNDVGSETQCTGSSLTTDDVSWGSLAASLLEENQTSETGFVSDVDLVEEAADVTSCSASSIHSVSDISCDSPDCSDDDADVRCSHFSPTTAVKQPLVVISDLTS